ncbi:hypothetical protein [Natroniella sp. ANB-PHB2]|uniref:hypothetical protein n=1 Tax=Natroniella sp. ANB-PHB2 TaxID=3384444 RepID=UPI0038D517A1
MLISDKEEVVKLLKKLKKSIDPLDLDYEFIFKKETNGFFGRYGILRKHIQEEIKQFTIANYLKGPESDHAGLAGEIWAFKFNVDDHKLYIKFRKADNCFICFRIHPDDESKECPYA